MSGLARNRLAFKSRTFRKRRQSSGDLHCDQSAGKCSKSSSQINARYILL